MTISNEQYYDHFSDTYDDERLHGYHQLIDDLESELVLAVATDKDVLEVGCGTGLILERVRNVARRSVGIDLSDRMLAHARERGLDVVQASATSLPFDDATFDVTYSFKVLSHVQQLELALEEMARVTRPGGRVFIELYNKHSLRYLIRKTRGGLDIGGGVDDNQVFFRFYSPTEMRRFLPANLRVTKQHGVRLFTVFPGMLKWPLIGRMLKRVERAGRSGALSRFGGFVVLECVRTP